MLLPLGFALYEESVPSGADRADPETMVRHVLVFTVALAACGGGSDKDQDAGHLRPATAAECPGGGSVLERDHGRRDVVCDGDVATEQVTPCQDVLTQIGAALQQYIDATVRRTRHPGLWRGRS